MGNGPAPHAVTSVFPSRNMIFWARFLKSMYASPRGGGVAAPRAVCRREIEKQNSSIEPYVFSGELELDLTSGNCS